MDRITHTELPMIVCCLKQGESAQEPRGRLPDGAYDQRSLRGPREEDEAGAGNDSHQAIRSNMGPGRRISGNFHFTFTNISQKKDISSFK